MNPIVEGIREAIRLLVTLDPEVVSIAGVSLKVSLASAAAATLMGIPMGFALATREFRGRGVTITLVNALLALPTVVVGLFCFALLSRQGPIGVLGLLCTPGAMAVGQTILATDTETFLWPVAADVIYVRGDLADVDLYAVDTVELLILATSLTDASVPESGAGFFYLVRPDCLVGSWQTSLGAEPGRDLALP